MNKPAKLKYARTHPLLHTHVYVKWHQLAWWMKRWIRCIHISEARTNHVSSLPQYLNTIHGVKRLHRKCQTVQALRMDCLCQETARLWGKKLSLTLQRQEEDFMMF